MAVSLSPFAGAGWQFFSDDGVPLAGGKLYTYAAGSTSSLATYTSKSGSTANTNPIILNSSGRLANEIWLTTGLNYKFILKTSADVLIGTWDNIPAGTTDVADLQAALASSTGAGMIGYIANDIGTAVATTVQAKLRETVSVLDFGAVGDGVTDDTTAFVNAVAAAKLQNKILDISDMKLYLATQTSSINLDGVIIQGDGKLPKVSQDTAYLNGADNSVAMWNSIRTGNGSGIFSQYNGPLFTGKNFNIKQATIIGDYTKANSSAFVQSTPTTYPGWSQALVNCEVDCAYFGSDGIKLLGGLEVCSPRNINVWLCGGYALNIVGNTSGVYSAVNAPIEYFDFDSTSSFLGGKLGNVYLNGFRRHIKFDGCLLNSAGQYDVQLAANPSFTIASQTAIISPIRITALAAGVYNGVNHSGSDHIIVRRCYAEVAQGICQIDGAAVNSAEITENSLIPWNNSLPKNLISIQNNLYRLRTAGNYNIDGSFPLYISSTSATNANDYVLQENTTANGVTFVGSTPINKKLIPVTYSQQSDSLGDGETNTLSSVQITGVAGQFSCSSRTLTVGMAITISGVFGGSGSISGYSDPTTYYIITTNGTTTFTLSSTLGGTAITTTAGTPTGLTYSVSFTYSLAINQQTPNNNAAVTAIWAISANFQSSALDRNETVLMAVTRLNSGNYVGQVLVPPPTTNLFSASPSINTSGVLSIPLTLYSRARVTRIDTQPSQIW